MEKEWSMKLDGGGSSSRYTGYLPVQTQEETEVGKPKKKKRPTLLTQMEGLLAGQGTEKGLIGGKEG